MHYAYILRSEKDGTKVYVGSTSDLKKRLVDHNRGTCNSTKPCIPWKIEWYCAFRSPLRARQFERYLKTGSGYAFRIRHFLDR